MKIMLRQVVYRLEQPDTPTTGNVSGSRAQSTVRMTQWNAQGHKNSQRIPITIKIYGIRAPGQL